MFKSLMNAAECINPFKRHADNERATREEFSRILGVGTFSTIRRQAGKCSTHIGEWEVALHRGVWSVKHISWVAARCYDPQTIREIAHDRVTFTN